MGFWKDLPNVSGILLTLIGAMVFTPETIKWLEQRKGTRLSLAIAFVILGIAGIIAGSVERRRSEKEQVLAEERQRDLRQKVDSTQKTLEKTQEMLNTSLLSQEHMRGQLDALGMMAGKIGQSSSEDMKQLVSAISKMAETSHVGTLTNKQLCDRAFELAKRLRAFGTKAFTTDVDRLLSQQREFLSAKTQDEKNVIWQKRMQEETQRWMNNDMEFRTGYVAEAIYLRDEITKRLPSVPQPTDEQRIIFRGFSGGSWGIFGGADYLEILGRTLCPR